MQLFAAGQDVWLIFHSLSSGKGAGINLQFIITCEHGGNEIPDQYGALFTSYKEALNSHRGYDPGALELAKIFARQLACPLYFSTTSRLLVELNRSIGSKALFSEITKQLPLAERNGILDKYYFPYRRAVKQEIQHAISNAKCVAHISVHSFTPIMEGEERRADIGLLYDPSRNFEKEFCQNWRRNILKLNPEMSVRMNYPYAGKADGFTTYLRKHFTEGCYLGIELEVNQKYPLALYRKWRELKKILTKALYLG